MNAKQLPARPSLEQFKKQAKDLVKAFNSGEPEAVQRIKNFHPHSNKLLGSGNLKARFALADAQLIIAREYGFESWPKFAKHVEALIRAGSFPSHIDPLADFIEAASVPLDWHNSGTLEDAGAILAEHPELASSDIYAAAILGDDSEVGRFLTLDPRSATAKGGPRGWDPLTYLCFSRYLRHDRTGSAGFVRAAQLLLDAGASANSGFYEKDHQPEPEFESVLYAAAGLARDADLTRLLLESGADPNNGEAVYHVPETYDNEILKILVQTGKLAQDSLATMLLRKHDWHDYDCIRFLLEHGADPNRMTRWHRTAMQQAVLRDNSFEIFELLLDHGADPTLAEGKSTIAMAAERGRGDLLESFEGRGIVLDLEGMDHLLAACARNDGQSVRTIQARQPQAVRDLFLDGGKILAQFAGVGNTEGVRQLLDLGVGVNAPFREGDGYWDVTKDSTALHVAAWRARHATVKLLIECGADVNAPDRKSRTPLALAVRACVDSHWKNRRSPESVQALLEAGASVRGVDFPSGYAEADELLQRYAMGEKS